MKITFAYYSDDEGRWVLGKHVATHFCVIYEDLSAPLDHPRNASRSWRLFPL